MPRKKTTRKKTFEPKATWMDLTADEAKEFIGYEEIVQPKGTNMPCFSFSPGRGRDKIHFIMHRNRDNRFFRIRRAQEYAQQMLEAVWAGQHNHPSQTGNGESWTMGSNEQAISLAHRSVALIIAETLRQADPDHALEAYGWEGPVTLPQQLVVTGIDPTSADSVDTGDPRKLNDVLFRQHEFTDLNGELSYSQQNQLSKALSTATWLTYQRVNGNRVARAPKLPHPVATQFLKEHPSLHEAVTAVWRLDSEGSYKKRISNFISLGYAAALLYLAAHANTDREKFLLGQLDKTRKPKGWNTPIRFWEVFATENYEEDRDETVKALHKLLLDNKQSDSKYERDALCTLVVRAVRAWEAGEALTPAKLKRALYRNIDERQVLQFERFGGLDCEKGVEEPTEQLLEKVGEWSLNEPCYLKGEGETKYLVSSFTSQEDCVVCEADNLEAMWEVSISDLLVDPEEEEAEELEEVTA